jgi:hypothetical protein
LRLANGEKLIAFQQNRDGAARPILPGMPLLAHRSAESAQSVRDEPS